MKKLVILTIVAALFIGIPFCVFAARQESRSDAMCKGLAAAFPAPFESIYGNLGQCVSYAQSCSDPGTTLELCLCRHMLNDPNSANMEYPFRTNAGLGPCIVFMRAVLP